jgi:hypothetical protein
MNTYRIATCTTLAMLLAGPALANHCSADFANVQSAANQATSLQPNVVSAVEALVPVALEACRNEALAMASAEPGSPMLEPNYVSVGQSMLINAADLLSGK